MASQSTPTNLDDFASITWATSYLSSPEWRILNRDRGVGDRNDPTDRFCRDTIRAFDGVQHWTELYKKPASGSQDVMQTISLFKFGTGLNGFPGICHGGAVMALMDEALAFAMVANELERTGRFVDPVFIEKLKQGRPLSEVLHGCMVTTKLDLQFLKPVLCPGIVGVDVEVTEMKGHKMRMVGVMKDGEGVPLVKAEGLWVRIGGAPKGKL